MLSTEELRRIRRQLENNPTRSTRKKLKKKLKEHEYASKYPKFSPFPHRRSFINRLIEEEKLIEVIEIVEKSPIFLVDTESVLVYHQSNRPGLIQIQAIPPDASPIVLIVEVNHLPPKSSRLFELMKQLFRIVLDSNNVLYTWGTIDELNEFVSFDLFDHAQLESVDNRNLQQIFKEYWQQRHQHQEGNDCICEECIGKDSHERWSLQDAVAYQLHEWLDKRQTCSPFDVGLDPALHESDQNESEFRRILTDYAANDCLSMEKLMVSMQENPTPSLNRFLSNDDEIEDNITEPIEVSVDQDMINPPMDLDPSTTASIHQATENNQLQEQERQESDHPEGNHRSETLGQVQSEHQPQDEQQDANNQIEDHNIRQNDAPILDEAREKRKRKNRRSTLKQRKRHYKHEIILRGIDRRFSITMVKTILRQQEVSYTAVNISTSSVNGRTSLYVGVRNEFRLREYHRRIKNLFSTDAYNEFRTRNHS